jgi:ADP-ribosylglycohydrolase
METVLEADENARLFCACLLGGALGDAVGLACENIGPRRIEKRFPDLDGPRLIGRRGMVSDDTEHALFTAKALALAGNDVNLFARLLQSELKMWLLGGPAGAGAATIKAALRSWRGAAPEECGVASAGNGPAMRAPIIGVWAASDEALLCALNRASSRLTHTDPRAEAGALCVALAARDLALRLPVEESNARLQKAVRAWMQGASTCDEGVGSLLQSVESAAQAARAGTSTWDFARGVAGAEFEQKGVSGFIAHTVPVALHAAWKSTQSAPGDVREGVLDAVRCGGDADSVAAIAASLIAIRTGPPGLPRDWVGALCEWPRGARYIQRAAQALAVAHARAFDSASVAGQSRALNTSEWPHAPFAGVLARNTFFTLVVLAHGFRRLAPPY